MALTPQQHEIASLAASGLTHKQVALHLCLSPRTVSGHLYRIFPEAWDLHPSRAPGRALGHVAADHLAGGRATGITGHLTG
jgi:FixJ family two-component response regulator